MEYVYVFVRADISLADQVCQVAHACLEAGKRFNHPANTNLVLLSVKDQAHLHLIANTCHRNRVDYFLNFEPDDDMGNTALATGPVTGSTRRLFSSMLLWRGYPQATVSGAV